MISAIAQVAPTLIVAGIAAGLLAGLFGIGGGLVVVPAVYFLLLSAGSEPSVAMAVAVGTSLVSIIPTAISSMRAHHKLGNVDWAVVRTWGWPLCAGVVFGAALVAYLRSTVFVVVFASLLLIVAVNKLFAAKFIRPLAQMPSRPVQAMAALVIGFVSVIAGVGGGATGVPTLTAFGLTIHRAVGTCAALGLCIALPGAISVFLLSATPANAATGTVHLVYVPAVIVLAPLTVLFAPLGAKLGKKLSALWLTRLFAGLLLVVSTRMLWSAWV